MTTTPTRIDFHHHYFTPEWYAYLTDHYERSYKFPGLPTLKKWSPAADIEQMDAGGVQTSLLSVCTPGIWFGDVRDARRIARNMNDFGAELVRNHRGRYGLFGVLPLPDIDSSLKEIAYVMDELKADGIGVLSSYDTKWLGDPSFAPIWEELNRRKAVVFSHATAPECCRETVPGLLPWVVEFNTDTARSIIQLIETGTAQRYPDISFVFSHAGGTISALAGRYLDQQASRHALAAEAEPDTKLAFLRRFYYDCAGSANYVNMQSMKMLVPMSQLVFGTDYPWYSSTAINQGLADAGLTPEELHAVERENALRLLPQFREKAPRIMTLDRRDFIKLGASASVAGLVTPGMASAQTLKSVRTISIPTDAAKQLLYAQQAGLFKKHGVQVDIGAMGSGAAIFAAVVGGTADFGSGAVFSVFTAYGHGVPLRIVAPISIYDTDHCDTWMIVAKDSPIRTPRDLSGKIMGADTPNDIYVNAVRVWCDQHGGDGKSVKAVELKPSEQFIALTSGRIDVVVLKPPYLTVAMQSGKVRVIGKPLDVIAPRFLLSCWVSTADYIEKNPEAVKDFVAALMESSRYVNRHQPETIEMVAKFSGQDPAVLGAGVRSVIAETISLADIQKPLDFATKYNVIDRHYDAAAILASSMPMTKTNAKTHS